MALIRIGVLSQQAYLNFHTTQFGNGEIRATLLLVPEPSSLALLGLALGGIYVTRRRHIA